jgi:hypothetical protein
MTIDAWQQQQQQQQQQKEFSLSETSLLQQQSLSLDPNPPRMCQLNHIRTFFTPGVAIIPCRAIGCCK